MEALEQVWIHKLLPLICAALGLKPRVPGPTGGVIPPDATLVYDVLLLDIWNTEDQIQIRTISKPASCRRASAASDFIRYHYNGTLLSGETFDSRCAGALLCISTTFWWVCVSRLNSFWLLVPQKIQPTTHTWGRETWSKGWTRVSWTCVSGRDGSLSSHPFWHMEKAAMVRTNIPPHL